MFRHRHFKYLNYTCETLDAMKEYFSFEFRHRGNVKPGIFLTKGQNCIESGFISLDRGCHPAYIPYYLSEDEFQNLTMPQYKNIIRILIKKYKESLVEVKIKELSKDFVENDQI